MTEPTRTAAKPPRRDRAGTSRLRRETHLALEGRHPWLGRSVALAVQAVIVVAAISFALATVRGLPPLVARVLTWVEYALLLAFALEYAMRVYAAPRRLGYVLSFWGLVDLCAWLPTLLVMNAGIQSVRALRLLQLFRLLKLWRHADAIGRLRRAVASIKEELAVYVVLSSVLIYFCAACIYFFERDAQPEVFGSIPNAMWWAIVTFTTVGYGDAYPITLGGRLFTAAMLFVALGLLAVPTGLLTSAYGRELAHRAAERQAERAAYRRALHRRRPRGGSARADTDPPAAEDE
ncbi:MAG: ion transporter [Pseudomonadota bacterium]